MSLENIPGIEAYHSPTRNPMEAKKATIPTMVEKWQALDSIFMTHTSMFISCMKNHPEEDTQPKTIMAKNWKKKNHMSHSFEVYWRIIWSYQSADSHANNGPSEEGEGVGCATGLGPSKGPLTIAPRVHPEDNVPQENRPRKRLNKLYVAASSSLCAKAAAVVAAAVEDRFTRLLLAAAKALLQVERRPCSRESSFYTLTLATDLI